jgi:hypothetical protein
MSLTTELAALFHRDLTRLLQEIEAFPDSQTLWRDFQGVRNSAGNLVLHLEGNLLEYVGRQLGGLAYDRRRDLEFSTTGLSTDDLAQRIITLRQHIPAIIEALSTEQLSAVYPENVLGPPLSTRQFLVHLHGHLNYHLGQIDYLRRVLTDGHPLPFAGL